MTANVYTIPASVPFLPCLIGAIRAGRFGFDTDDPLAMARATLFLPTQRACQITRDVFRSTMPGDSSLLPRIVALGNVDEDELGFLESGLSGTAVLDAPASLSALERRLVLSKLILKAAPMMSAAGGAPLMISSPSSALQLADALARLMDDMATRQVPWERLDDLVPDEYDEYWRLTLAFLKIARNAWPAYLAERGLIDAASRRDRLIALEVARLAAIRGAPVIAAGSTGSMPATASLLHTIANLPNGAVVLPGLDTQLDDASWAMIGGEESVPGHPQFAMQVLLTRIGIAREDVKALAESASPHREQLISEALRPASSTERWNARIRSVDFADTTARALSNVALIAAANPEEEALAIAIALRETLNAPDATASLITPDRALARRVMAQLARWNIAPYDSAGQSLAETPAGILACLVAEVTLSGYEPAPLLALLKHPLCRFNKAQEALSALEGAVLRGPRPSAGSGGLARALETFASIRETLHPRDPRKQVRGEDVVLAAQLVQALAADVVSLELLTKTPHALSQFIIAHRAALEAISDQAIFQGEGVALAGLFDDLTLMPDLSDLVVHPRDYLDLFRSLMADRVVRTPSDPNARIQIFGLLEARLHHSDRVILGGLVEGVWPPDTRTDAWLSRPMREQLGLDLPERRIGLTAHDFAQAFGSKDVILTASGKIAGSPTIASRFTQRLAALAGPMRWGEAQARGQIYLDYARQLDWPDQVEPVKSPQPKPPLAARPKRLTVTEIEDLLRDPYTIYARHVLRLRPIDPIDTSPAARDRGNAVHAALEAFTKQYAATLPDDPERRLIELGRVSFAPLRDYPEAEAFWWPRFVRIARWFANFETRRRASILEIKAEARGEIDITPSFRLGARADRIEILRDGRLAILDYKTGQVPSDSQVLSGLSPQLTLQGAILRHGGFDGIKSGSALADLAYVGLRGGDPAGEFRSIEFKDSSADAAADHALAELTKVIRKFESEDQAYASLVSPMWKKRYGDYDHLSRVKEWSATGGDAQEDGE